MATFFADHFGIDPESVEDHGAFNISLVTDLPLFIDPFLLFNSAKPEYQELHHQIIRYLVFLRDKSVGRPGPRCPSAVVVLLSGGQANLAWLLTFR